MQHDTVAMDVIETADGREIDITHELREIVYIERQFALDSTPHPADRKFLHRFGWGLVAVGGVGMALDLIDDLLEDQEINPAFAAYLRTKWTAIADRME